MRKSKKILLFGAIFSLSSLLIFIFSNNNENAKAYSSNPTMEKNEAEIEGFIEEMHDGATIAKQPTKAMWVNAINISEDQQLLRNKDQQLQKWVIRTYLDKEITDEKVSIPEIIKIAEERLKYENAWLKIATENYKIVYTDEEVDAWISNGPDEHPLPTMFEQAEALGLTLEELNHEYDRDFYIKWVVWEKLYPILAEKYDVDLNAEYQSDEPMPNTILVNYYDLEIKEYLLEK